MMLRKSLIAAGVLFFAVTVKSNLPVIDVASIAHQITSFLVQVQQKVVEAESAVANQTTALKSVQEVENQITQLLRMGDPANLTNLSGVQAIAQLQQIYAQGLQDLQTIDALTHPNNISLTEQQVLERYNLQSFRGYTSGLGVVIGKP